MACNKPMITLGFDATAYNEKNVALRGIGGTFTMPEYLSSEGYFPDVLTFLNGHCCFKTFEERLQELWSELGGDEGLSAYINEDGFIQIDNDSSFGLLLNASPDNLYYGFPQLGFTILAGDSFTGTKFSNELNMRVPGDPSSGVNFLSFQRIGNPNERFIPESNMIYQNIPIMFRKAGVDNILDMDWIGLKSLQSRDNQGALTDRGRIQWGLTKEGKVWRSASRKAGVNRSLFTWDGPFGGQLARDLGFTGNEVLRVFEHPDYEDPQDSDEEDFTIMTYLEAECVCPYVLAPKRSLYKRDLRLERVNPAERAIGGQYSSIHVGTYPSFILGFILEGPARYSETTSETTHFLYAWSRLVSFGESVFFYQNFPEIRQARVQCFGAFRAEPFSNDVVTSKDGKVGLWHCYYSKENGTTTDINFGSGSSGVELLSRQEIILDNVLDQIQLFPTE